MDRKQKGRALALLAGGSAAAIAGSTIGSVATVAGAEAPQESVNVDVEGRSVDVAVAPSDLGGRLDAPDQGVRGKRNRNSNGVKNPPPNNPPPNNVGNNNNNGGDGSSSAATSCEPTTGPIDTNIDTGVIVTGPIDTNIVTGPIETAPMESGTGNSASAGNSSVCATGMDSGGNSSDIDS